MRRSAAAQSRWTRLDERPRCRPIDTIENLVFAHEACNGAKRDFLAAERHLARWSRRLHHDGPALTALADTARWETGPARTLGVARTLYLPLRPDARLWSTGASFELALPASLRAALAVAA